MDEEQKNQLLEEMKDQIEEALENFEGNSSIGYSEKQESIIKGLDELDRKVEILSDKLDLLINMATEKDTEA